MLALLLPSTCWQASAIAAPQPCGSRLHLPARWWQRIVLAVMAIASLSGCVLRPPQSAEETQVDSQITGELVAAGVSSKPFCLHVRYKNHFFPAYSDDKAEAWVTDGLCSSKGAPRKVGTLRLSWWNDWDDTQTNRQCQSTERCTMDEQRIVLSRNIRCAAAQVADGPDTAFITTDGAICH